MWPTEQLTALLSPHQLLVKNDFKLNLLLTFSLQQDEKIATRLISAQRSGRKYRGRNLLNSIFFQISTYCSQNL
jgi:hypothetical protein